MFHKRNWPTEELHKRSCLLWTWNICLCVITILCRYCYNKTTEKYHVNKYKTRLIIMQNISLCHNKLSINSQSCTTFTTDVQNVQCLQWHKHRDVLMPLIHCTVNDMLSKVFSRTAATPPWSRSPWRLASGARPIQYSLQGLDPDCWDARAIEEWNLASIASAALPSLACGELVPRQTNTT